MLKEVIFSGDEILSEDTKRIEAMKAALAEMEATFASDELDDLGRGIILIELVKRLEKRNGLSREKSEVIQRTIDYAVRKDIVGSMRKAMATA